HHCRGTGALVPPIVAAGLEIRAEMERARRLPGPGRSRVSSTRAPLIERETASIEQFQLPFPDEVLGLFRLELHATAARADVEGLVDLHAVVIDLDAILVAHDDETVPLAV